MERIMRLECVTALHRPVPIASRDSHVACNNWPQQMRPNGRLRRSTTPVRSSRCGSPGFVHGLERSSPVARTGTRAQPRCVCGQGDLFEVMIRCDIEVNRPVRLLDAHRGVLDRFDTMLVAADGPVASPSVGPISRVSARTPPVPETGRPKRSGAGRSLVPRLRPGSAGARAAHGGARSAYLRDGSPSHSRGGDPRSVQALLVGGSGLPLPIHRDAAHGHAVRCGRLRWRGITIVRGTPEAP